MIVAIIQARMGSTRLPGKILRPILGKPAIEHEILRVRRSKYIDKTILATTDKRSDDKPVRIFKKINVPFFRGSEKDVLDRYYQAAKAFHADYIVRITGDCPLIDPAVIDLVVGYYLRNRGKFDYVSNVHPPTFPDGMDVEVFSFKTLETAWKKARLPSEREHVTPYIWKRPKIFRLGNVSITKPFPQLRLTLDEPQDLRLIRKIFQYLYPHNRHFSLSDILKLFRDRPELRFINAGIVRNEGLIKSLKSDKLFLQKKRSKKR